MGSRGSFLESGGFSAPAKWHTVGFIEGIKVLEKKDHSSVSLPERSNTPGTKYLAYRKNGTFYQLRVFKSDRTPDFDIDYGMHRGKISLHVHYYIKGIRQEGDSVVLLHKEDPLYKKFRNLFKGVIL